MMQSSNQEVSLKKTVLQALPARVVTIGTSKGGLKALGHILAKLPSDFPAAIVIVQHLSPSYRSLMAFLLNRQTPLRVKDAQQGDQLTPGTVYIAPPNYHVTISRNATLSLSLTAKVHHVRPSASVLFESAAKSLGARVIGVILTGGDSDGADGIRAIKANGGVTITQSQETSEAPSMPLHAMLTGDVDFILPLTDIASKLIALLALPILTDPHPINS